MKYEKMLLELISLNSIYFLKLTTKDFLYKIVKSIIRT